MPRYQYVCEPCKATWEVQKLMCESETPELCPECKKKADRDFITEVSGQYSYMGVRTLGAARDQNTSKFSEDYKHHLQNTSDNKELG